MFQKYAEKEETWKWNTSFERTQREYTRGKSGLDRKGNGQYYRNNESPCSFDKE